MSLELLSDAARDASGEKIRDRFVWAANSLPKWIDGLIETAPAAEDRVPIKVFHMKTGKLAVRNPVRDKLVISGRGVGRSIAQVQIPVKFESGAIRRKVILPLTSEFAFVHVAFESAKEDAHTLIVASDVKSPSRRSLDFPSESLAQFVVEKARADAKEYGEAFEVDLDSARQHIRTVVFGLLRVMGQSLSSKSAGEQRGVLLSKDGKFAPPVAEALLARISVSYYESFEFTNSLHEELLEAAPISGMGWTLSRAAPNALEVLAVDAPQRSRVPDVSRRKARVVRFGAAV